MRWHTTGRASTRGRAARQHGAPIQSTWLGAYYTSGGRKCGHTSKAQFLSRLADRIKTIHTVKLRKQTLSPRAAPLRHSLSRAPPRTCTARPRLVVVPHHRAAEQPLMPDLHVPPKGGRCPAAAAWLGFIGLVRLRLRLRLRLGLQGWLVSVERFGLSLPTVQNLG